MRRPTLLISLLGLVACSPSTRATDAEWTPIPAPDLGVVVARVGQVPIFANQIQAEARRAGKTAREALDDLVAFNLLAERARRDGRRPAASSEAEVKSALVQRLLERELEPNLRAEVVPDSVLRPIYERAKDSFVHPRLVEIGVLAVYTGALMKGQPRREREQTARELAAYVKDHPAKSLEEFAAVASDPSWAKRSVVFGRFIQGLDKPLSQVVGAEVAKLRAPGDSTRQLADEDGFFIARYISERPPQNVTFEETRAKLLAGFLEHYQQKEFLEFTNRLLQLHEVKAYFDRLPRNEQGP